VAAAGHQRTAGTSKQYQITGQDSCTSVRPAEQQHAGMQQGSGVQQSSQRSSGMQQELAASRGPQPARPIRPKARP